MSDLTRQPCPIKSNCYWPPCLTLVHCFVMLPLPSAPIPARLFQTCFRAPTLTPTSPIILSGHFNVSPVQPRTGWDQTSSHKSGGVAFDLTTFQFRAKISTGRCFSCRLSGLKWDYPLRGKTSTFKKGTGSHASIASKRHDDLCIVSVLREICHHRSTKPRLNL